MCNSKITESSVSHAFSSSDVRSNMSVYSRLRDDGTIRVIMFDLSGQAIVSSNNVEEILKDVDVIISHNASFDKPFIDSNLELSKNKLWACSMKDIDWMEKGFVSSKQEMLCLWHGFYFDAHRAMNDVDALIHLITHPFYENNKPIIELYNNSKIVQYNVWVTNFPYNAEKKDKIKSNGYFWNNEKKLWFKRVSKEELEKEKQYLIKIIYFDTFDGFIEAIDPKDKYKS